MRDEKIVRDGVVLRQRLLEKNRQAARAIVEAARKGLSAPEIAPCLPTYERPRRKRRRERGYVSPSKHGGVRNVARNSQKNERGFTIFKNHEVQHESGLEHKVSIYLQADPTVHDLFSQKVISDYVDDDGKKRFTVFDFLIIKTDGSYVGVAVKPEKYRARMERMFNQIAETGTETQIDEAIFISNAQVTRARFANARNILWSRHDAHPGEVKLLKDFVSNRTQVEFWELYDRKAIGHWGRKAAIWQLIDLGILVPNDDYERIDDLTFLNVNL